jgi:hypothetical protein
VIKPPKLPSEDYSVFIALGIPSLYFTLGGANPAKFADFVLSLPGCSRTDVPSRQTHSNSLDAVVSGDLATLRAALDDGWLFGDSRGRSAQQGN